MKRCAFLSMRDLTGYLSDDGLAVAALNTLGWSVATNAWCDTSVNWAAYDLVVVRSTWDYHHRPGNFLSTLRRIERSGAVLANPLNTIEWNINKRYLRELASRGVDIVPTHWGRAGTLPDAAELFTTLGCDELVLKRVVGAGAQNAYRLRSGETDDIWDEVQNTYANQDWMAQPFLDSVINDGESSLFFFDGEFSHAVRKVPKTGDYRVQEEYGSTLTRIDPGADLRTAADVVMARVAATPLYARVDLVRGTAGAHQLMELELIEPALYLRLDESAPEKFARALDRWWNSVHTYRLAQGNGGKPGMDGKDFEA